MYKIMYGTKIVCITNKKQKKKQTNNKQTNKQKQKKNKKGGNITVILHTLFVE